MLIQDSIISFAINNPSVFSESHNNNTENKSPRLYPLVSSTAHKCLHQPQENDCVWMDINKVTDLEVQFSPVPLSFILNYHLTF